MPDNPAHGWSTNADNTPLPAALLYKQRYISIYHIQICAYLTFKHFILQNVSKPERDLGSCWRAHQQNMRLVKLVTSWWWEHIWNLFDKVCWICFHPEASWKKTYPDMSCHGSGICAAKRSWCQHSTTGRQNTHKKKQQQLHFEIKLRKLNEKKSAICLWLEVRDGVTLPNSEEDRLNKRRMS